MKLSLVIVNYNMCAMLRQSLNALKEACKNIEYELFVIDNASADRSVAMLKKEFPDINLIINAKTEGTAQARNRGIKQATGEYVLMVNADTIAITNTIESTLNFMDRHTDAGALGVRMLSSTGSFLKVSKVGFNKAWGVFFKMTGLAKHFPKSRLYKGVNENSIEDFETTEVDVVNGAFMLVRRSILNQVGLLDERFSLFGYDIDLSFRIRIVGYKNYYFPKTFILNFRKQVIPKFSLLYLKNFYGAMFIFAVKYLFKLPVINMPAIPQVFAPKYEIER